ncbi:MAG: glycosyltransferase family 4 protein [Chloroflexaceae bacterium]|nr:glycosyltransferase family 4 protein [Chloroflexaceae bacterium]
MRIGLDARYATDYFPGIGRYVAGLAAALAELEHGHTLVLIHNPALPNSRHNLAELARFPGVELVATNARPFSLAEHVRLPLLARQLRLDLLHSPYYVKPYAGLPCPSVVTIYDLIGWKFPKTLSPRGRLLYRVTMSLAVRRSDSIITISQSARDDLAFVYRLPQERIAVTPLAADGRFRPQPPERVAALRAAHQLPPRYVLYLGANKPHKNLERLLRAWERVVGASSESKLQTGDCKLIIAGHEDPRYPQARHMVTERGLSASVRFLPNVAEADLPALYSGAEIFVFPSYYEGFGLPPLEAMACGTPVLCAYGSSLPEVVGNAALTVDPYSAIDMAEGLRRLLHNHVLRQQLRESGLQRARQFTWRRTALATLPVYEGLVKRTT